MKKFLSLVLALVMTMSLVTISAGAKDFTDTDDVTYAEAVDVLSAVKVIDGYTDGSFKPTAQLNRGQAAKILCNMILGPTTASALKADSAPFKDVAADSTFAGYIAYCAQAGIIDGYTDGTFRPAAPLTGYAFMKLLLGALGYDKDVEGYNVPNWSINVAKRALAIGLDDGLTDDFDGTKIVTREEACLFALNTLKADMVDYDAKTSVNVGGAEVVIAGSSAKVVANKGKTDGNIDNDDEMQFAEKYFTKLVMNDTTSDDFGRPATKWTVNNDKVGTYTKTPDLKYTKSVDLGDIYADLDLDHQIDATLVLNGNTAMAKEPVQRGVTTDLSNSAYGVLSEVYYDADADTIKIVQVNTYIGQITAVKEETKAKDAYVTVGETLKNYGVLGTTTDDFETDEAFEVDDYVLFTFANNKIQSVEKAESVEGTLNTIYKKSKIDIDGTTYSFSEKKTFSDATSDFNVKSSYVVYLDKYGYAIHLEESEFVSGDYAFVEDARYATGTWGYKQAKLVYLDGTTAKVDNDKNYAASGDLDYATNNYLVTFKTNSKDETIMKKVDGTQYYSTFNKSSSNYYTFHMKNGDAAIFIADNDGDNVYDAADTDLRVFANSKTMFVVKNTTTGKYKAYTGVKAMPSINTGTTKYPVSISYYCKSGDVLTYAFIQAPGAAITSGTEDITFLSGVSLSKHTTDTDLQDYYTYNAVVAGEITTIRVAANQVPDKANKIYTDSALDADGIVISYTPASASAAQFGVGVKKLSGEYTLGFNVGGNYEYYTVADDCQVFMVDEDGEITKSTVSAVVTDASQAYSVYLNSSYEVKYLFLDEVTTAVAGTPLGGSTTYTVTASVSSGAVNVAVKSDDATKAGTAVTVEKVVITNLTNNHSTEVSGSFATPQTLDASGNLTATAITGFPVTGNGLTSYTVYLKIGTEIVKSSNTFA